MKKIKLFPAPHVEIRIHVSEEMERDYADIGVSPDEIECMKTEGKRCW